MNKIKHIHIAKSPCYPHYGVVVQYSDGRELWDCDCAGSTEADVLAKAEQAYPRRKVLMWGNPRHYSNACARMLKG